MASAFIRGFLAFPDTFRTGRGLVGPLRGVLASVALGMGSLAAGQPVFEAPDPSAVAMSDRVLEVDAAGLRLRLPVGAESVTRQVGGKATTSVVFPGGLGSMSVQRLSTTRTNTPLLEVEAALLTRTLGLPENMEGVTIESQIETGEGESLGRSPFVAAGGRILRPFYVRLKGDLPEPVLGFAVIGVTADEFVLFQMFSSEGNFARAREVFEVVLGTLEVRETEELDRERGVAIDAGTRVLEGLTVADYDAVVGDIPEQFERIYRAAPGGAVADETEIGYRRVKAWIGTREELTGDAPSAGGKPGYLLRVDGLILLEDGRRADSRSIYFLSRDRSQEAWTVDMAVRSATGGKPEVWSELGARSGRSMTVQISSEGSASRVVRPAIESSGYISRLESFILPQLLIKAGREGTFAFYAYDQGAETNTLRSLEVRKAEDRPGVWRVVSRKTDGDPESSEFNEFGRLIRSEGADGLLKRPIEFDRLYSIWQSKGLPLD